MKQFIILLLILGGGYYFYTHGLQQTFQKINLEPKTLIKEQKKEDNNPVSASPNSQKNGLPEIAPERLSGLKISSSNMNKVEEVVFNTYDADTCFAYVDMIYSSGSSASARVINKYLTTFDVPDDRNKIITLITKYKDKQSLKILEDLMKRGAFSRKMLLNKIAQYNTEESTDVIKKVAESSNNDSLAAEAKSMLSEIINFNKMESGNRQTAARRMQMLMNDPNADMGEYQ